MLRLVLLAQVPGYIAIAGLLAVHYEAERVRADEQLMAQARSLALALGERTAAVERYLPDLARRVPSRPALLHEFRRDAAEAARIAGLGRIVLARRDGRVLLDTSAAPSAAPQQPLRLRTVQARPGGAELVRLEEEISPPRMDITVPVNSEGDYILLGRLEARWFQALLTGFRLPEGRFSAVVDERGIIVARLPPAPQLVGRPVTEPLRTALRSHDSGVVEVTTGDDVRVVTAFVRLPGLGWSAIVSLPRTQLYAAMWRSAGIQALAVAGLLATTLGLSLRIRRRLLTSVDALRLQAETLAQPDANPPRPLAFAEAAVVSARLQSSADSMRDAQARLRASEERLRTIVQTARDAIVVVDAAERIVMANHAAGRMFRAPADTLQGRPLQELLEPDTWTDYLAQLGHPPEEGGQEPLRGQARRSDGSVFPIEYSPAQFTGEGGERFCTIVARDITRRLQQRESLLATRTELQRVHSNFRHAVMRETESLGRELHDAIGSSLAGVSLLLGTARSYTREPEAAVLISRSEEQVRRATRQLRELSHGLLAAADGRGALLLAFEHFAEDMNAIPGLRCTLGVRGDFEDVPPGTTSHLFRILQEATTNAMRHGLASEVRIVLVRLDGRCRLSVSDNGLGFDPAVPLPRGAGMGIASMRARAAAIGGSFRLMRRPSGGMRVRVTWTAPDEPVPLAQGPGA